MFPFHLMGKESGARKLEFDDPVVVIVLGIFALFVFYLFLTGQL